MTRPPESETEHLDGVADGAGCTETWEHLSEGRETVDAS